MEFGLISLEFRMKDETTYQATTWQIKFKLDAIQPRGTYKLRLALASANQAELQVNRFNSIQVRPLCYSKLIAKTVIVNS